MVEAMLRGIPVLPSDLGGLPEAKMDTGYIFPVRLIRKYLASLDEHLLPFGDLPDQDVRLWCSEINGFIRDSQLYREVPRRLGISPTDFSAEWIRIDLKRH